MTHIFGPVPSRRLGRSLGIDLVPFKTCTLDCIYCECGPTTDLTLSRREYVPTDEVLAELGSWLDGGGEADIITFSGSGEPTLHSHLGIIAEAARTASSLPLCLLTNGTLLHRPDVREEAARADIVIPSLDAADEETFRAINRPHPDLDLRRYLDGLRAFADEFTGDLWLEVFIVPGLNDDDRSVHRLAALAEELHPARIQLNTAVRTPAVRSVAPATPERLTHLASLFTPAAEVIASFHRAVSAPAAPPSELHRQILALITRRPCTAKDISQGLHIRLTEVLKHLDPLLGGAVVGTEERGGEVYYFTTRERGSQAR